MKKYNYLPYNKKLTARAKELRSNMTVAEKKLWHEYLRNHEYIFLRQKPIDNYIVDFYCSSLELVIEIDGASHLDKNENITQYDLKRDKDLEKYGLTVLRFWNSEVKNSFDSVVERINNFIKEKNPPSPLYQGGAKKME